MAREANLTRDVTVTGTSADLYFHDLNFLLSRCRRGYYIRTPAQQQNLLTASRNKTKYELHRLVYIFQPLALETDDALNCTGLLFQFEQKTIG